MLTAFHGIPTTPDQVLVTTGGQQALDLLLRCEVAPGHPVVTDNPTYPGFIDALYRSGARPVGVPPGDMARLADAVTVHQPALAYLTPTHQNPTGLVLPAAERHEIVALARRHPGVTFIDDMTLAELPLGPGDCVDGVSRAGSPPAGSHPAAAARRARAPAAQRGDRRLVLQDVLGRAAHRLGARPRGHHRPARRRQGRRRPGLAALPAGHPGGAGPVRARGDRRLPGRLGPAAVRGRRRRRCARSCPTGRGRRRPAG